MDDPVNELVSVIDVASRLERRKQTIFKILKRLGIEPIKRRNSSNGNQFISYVKREDFERVRAELHSVSNAAETGATPNSKITEILLAEKGVFYLIQLEAKHDPCRFKVGFTSSMDERLRHLRCSAPFAAIVKTWPCRQLWEKTAIDCVTVGCDRLHTEVFRARNDTLDKVVIKCDRFFDLMPVLENASG